MAKNNFSVNRSNTGFINNRSSYKCLARLACWWSNIKFKMKQKWPKLDKKKIGFWIVAGILGLSLFLLVVGLGMMVWFARDLPTPSNVVRRDGFTSRIYDRNGELLYDVYKDAKRNPVEWDDVPEYLKQATIAVEDKDFYKHKGFDPLTPFRIAKNLITEHRLIGGSTLTQQLVKNVLLTSDRTITRKMKEFILAVQIEAKYSKDDILLMYLNEAPYGGASWGVGTATEQYFGKSVSELDLVESVILAGLPQRPSVYSPFSRTPKAYVDRTAHVLDRMVEDGYLDEEKGKEVLVLADNYQFYENQDALAVPHFVFWVKDLLSEKYGEDVVEGGGLRVTTTLDLEMQKRVQEIVSQEVDKAEAKDISNGAAVVVDPETGQVLAMVGSRGYFSDKTDGKFNVATQALRQPGSSIKPITYLTAFQRGYTPASLIMDTPVTFPGGPGQKDYSPKNYNGKFNGPMSLRTALGNSINTTAVKTLARVGVSTMLKQAYEMGLTTLEPTKENLSRFGLAVTLGGAEVKMTEMAEAYSSFANGGKRVDLVGVLKVEDRNGRVMEEYKAVDKKRVMTEQEAFLINDILSDNSARALTFGEINGLIIPNYKVAVKTGTTNDMRDNWAIGWTPNLLAVAWVGNNDNSPMNRVASGVSGATPIWKRIMVSELPRVEKKEFTVPSGIVQVEVDAVSGYRAHDGFASKQEYFIEGTVPGIDDPIHLKLKVCKDGGGIAPPADVATGNYDEKEFFKFREEDPISSDGKNRWQEGIDSWIAEQEDKDKYYPPEDFCRSDGLVSVRFDTPSDRQKLDSNEFDVKLKTSSIKKIVEAKLYINGDENKSWSERPFETRLSLADGTYTLKAWVKDRDGETAEREIKIGVKREWDWAPSPTPTMTPIPTDTPIPTATGIIPSVMVTVEPTLTTED